MEYIQHNHIALYTHQPIFHISVSSSSEVPKLLKFCTPSNIQPPAAYPLQHQGQRTLKCSFFAIVVSLPHTYYTIHLLNTRMSVSYVTTRIVGSDKELLQDQGTNNNIIIINIFALYLTVLHIKSYFLFSLFCILPALLWTLC